MKLIDKDEPTCYDNLKCNDKLQVFDTSDADETMHFNEIRTEFNGGHPYRDYDTDIEERLSKKCNSQTNCFQRPCSDLSKSEPTEMVYNRSPHLHYDSTTSKSLREVYIGNLPQGLTVSELLEYINRSMMNNNVMPTHGNPVISAWINYDGKYAFCECRSIEEANALLKLNNLLTLHGNLLRVGKPKVSEHITTDQQTNNSALINQITQATNIISPYFNNIPLILKKETILITGINKSFVLEDVKKTFSDNKKIEILELLDHRNKYKIAICEADPNINITDKMINQLGNEIQIIKMKNLNSKIVHTVNGHLKSMVTKTMEEDKQVTKTETYNRYQNMTIRAFLLPQKPCRCILLSKILMVEELLIPTTYSSIHEEIHEKCSSYGEIYKTIIPKPEKSFLNNDQHIDTYFGRAFIFFFNVESAIKAKVDLYNMRFLGRSVKISYYSEREFLKGNFFLCEPNRCDPMNDKELSKIINMN